MPTRMYRYHTQVQRDQIETEDFGDKLASDKYSGGLKINTPLAFLVKYINILNGFLIHQEFPQIRSPSPYWVLQTNSLFKGLP